MGLATYIVQSMKVARPGDKTLAKNPDRLYTITGKFFSTSEGPKGAVLPKDLLTITSKNVTREDALTEGFRIDFANGIVTLPEGERGRKAFPALSAEDVAADLAALAASAVAEDSGEDSDSDEDEDSGEDSDTGDNA